MVRVEAPLVTVTPPPPRERVVPWLAVLAVVFLGLALVPWERWCGFGAFDDELVRCFSARLWSGSASLLGSAAIVLLIAYLIATARVGVRARVGAVRLSIFACAMTAVAAKVLIATENDLVTSQNQSLAGSASVGVWIGALGSLAGFCLVGIATWTGTSRVRSLIVLGVVMSAVTAVAIPYARAGLAWWGGPIAQPASLGGGNGVGLTLAPGESGMLSGLLYFRNPGAVAATFDSLELLEGSRGIDVLGTYAVTQGPCDQGSVELPARLLPDGCAYPLAGFRFPPGRRNDIVQLVMVVEVQRPGVYRSGWIRVRYHAGILPFEIFRTDMMVICAPEQGKNGCPGDGF